MSSGIKNHFQKYKVIYIVGGVLIIAGATTLIMRKNIILRGGMDSLLRGGIEGSGKTAVDNTARSFLLSAKDSIGDTLAVQKTPLETHGSYIFKNSVVNFGSMDGSTVSVVERVGRGHPGYLTRCLENNLVYKSQRAAADALNLNPAHLSDHLNGLRDHVGGMHFERLLIEP